MEFGDELKELNVTVDEMERLTKALKDETFREMLHDYAKELSDPENKKRYEEEIKIMERERGNTIEFIHPEPFRALRTSVNGDQKCFINICSNEKVGKPVCKPGVSEEGRGQCWSLPHNLHPVRQERDPKGSKIVIYDVIFHPDTLYIASKNRALMDVVQSAAFEGIQNAFSVSLDKNNVREMKTKYKGTPQPCVVRKPIPGYRSEEPPQEEHDPLAFPYPDGKRPTTSSHADATESPVTKKSSHVETQGPTEPKYTVTYRSFIDLQDFRCSRDSAPSPRPREIVVTVDLPLLKVARDASLVVEERRLLLESKEPAYRLELPLAYPVDGDEGGAKFNKQRGQLTVTLPVLPFSEAHGFAVGLAETSTGGDERQEERKREVEEEEGDTWKEQRGDDEEERVKDERDVEGEQTRAEKGEDEGGGGCEEEEDVGLEEAEKWKQTPKGQESVEDEKEVENFDAQKRQHGEDLGGRKHNELPEDGQNRAAEEKDSGVTGCQCDSVDRCADAHAEENSCEEITAELSRCGEKGRVDVDLIPRLESKPKTKTSDVREKMGETEETLENLELGKGAAFRHDTPADTQSHNIEDRRVSEDTSKVPETGDAKESGGGGGSDDRVPRYSEELATGSVDQEEGEDMDEDDLPTAQLLQSPEHADAPPSALREIDEHGDETAIGDHSTSAGFVFQNSLMYELD